MRSTSDGATIIGESSARVFRALWTACASRPCAWMLAAFVLAVQFSRAQASEGDGSPPPPRNAQCAVMLTSGTGIQLDVWIDGKRRGMTPVTIPLAPGRHVATAFAPDTFPIVQPFTVRDEPRQASVLADKPLYEDRLRDAFAYLVKARAEHPQNVHVLEMCASMAMERTDFEALLAMIPEERQADPVLQVAKAKWRAIAGDLEGSLALVHAATELDSTVAACWRAKSELLAKLGRTDEGRDAADRSVLLDPHNPKSFMIRAKIEEADGNARGAELDMEHAGELARLRNARARKMGELIAKDPAP